MKPRFSPRLDPDVWSETDVWAADDADNGDDDILRGYTVEDVDFDPNERARCDNCSWTGLCRETEAVGRTILCAGCPSPVGRCPECGALSYPFSSWVPPRALEQASLPKARRRRRCRPCAKWRGAKA